MYNTLRSAFEVLVVRNTEGEQWNTENRYGHTLGSGSCHRNLEL